MSNFTKMHEILLTYFTASLLLIILQTKTNVNTTKTDSFYHACYKLVPAIKLNMYMKNN